MSTGQEGSTAALSGEEEALMRAFARVVVTLPRALDAALLVQQGLSSTEYLTLMHLSEAPQRRLRMSDLAGAVALSLSGMSRIVQRLAAGGLVQRQRSVDDGRGWYAVLTETGLKRLQDAWPSHLASTRRHIFDHLQAVPLPALTAALESMATAATAATAAGVVGLEGETGCSPADGEGLRADCPGGREAWRQDR